MNFCLLSGKLFSHQNKILQVYAAPFTMRCLLLSINIARLSNFPRGNKFLSKLWITSALRKSIYVKNNLYKKFVKTRSTYIHTRFKLYRNKLNHLLKISKKEYYNRYFFDNIYDSKKIWKRVKQIVNFKPPTSVKHIELRVNDRKIASPIEVANIFNSYFSNIGNDLT